MMEYGEGYYIEVVKRYQVKIIVGKSKFYIRGLQDYAETYLPLEKIESLKKKKLGIEIRVRLSGARNYTAFIGGNRKELSRLIADLVRRLSLKKRFLREEWTGEAYWR